MQNRRLTTPVSQTKYRLEIHNKALQTWNTFQEEIPDALNRCKKFLEENPEDRLKANGELKKLKGELKEILQYDVTEEARIWYVVDKANRIVRIKYVGHHPK